MIKEYEDYKKLIYKKAYEYSRKYNYDSDDLISEGNLIFCNCLKHKDYITAEFSTYLYTALNNGLRRYIQKDKVHFENIDNHKDDFSFFDKIEIMNMTENTRTLIDTINKEIGEKSKRTTKQQVYNYMRSKGWKNKQINNSFAEVKHLLAQLA